MTTTTDDKTISLAKPTPPYLGPLRQQLGPRFHFIRRKEYTGVVHADVMPTRTRGMDIGLRRDQCPALLEKVVELMQSPPKPAPVAPDPPRPVRQQPQPAQAPEGPVTNTDTKEQADAAGWKRPEKVVPHLLPNGKIQCRSVDGATRFTVPAFRLGDDGKGREDAAVPNDFMGWMHDMHERARRTTQTATAKLEYLRTGSQAIADACAHCGKPATTVCSRCRCVSYCSRECQKAAWRIHKLFCKQEGKEAQA